ncbi:MAG: phosphoglucosamine mutase [bacterium]
MSELFGTDGVRGVANRELTAELAFRIGRAGAFHLMKKGEGRGIVIGKDTRISGDMLEGALSAGICSVGMDVLRVGIMPTPAVAHLTSYLKAAAGVVISASHNPIADNGIKFFSSKGFKLPDELERRIEETILAEDHLPRPEGADIGRVIEVEHAHEMYLHYIKRMLSGDFSGLRIVLDCAFGAAFFIAPRLFKEMGAEVIALHADPDGSRINVDCGATRPKMLQEAVISHGADVGIAFDGDADRVIAVDEKGEIVNGDKIMAIFAADFAGNNKLPHDLVVSTVMSNLGLEKALEEIGVHLARTAVGDRYVLEEMLKSGARLGGEQSGHIILLDYNTTGDGIVTAVHLIRILRDRKTTLSELTKSFRTYPQILVNVPASRKDEWRLDDVIQQAVREVEKRLKGRGRLVIRPSGTEPLLRIMAEGPDEEELNREIGELAGIVRSRLE